ncbi:MAG: phosphoribosylanthranilate isomerase [Muricomes sp.]
MMKIKICGLTRLEDIEAVNEVRPDLIGFVFAKNSRRYVTPEQAALLKSELNPGILAVGVFVDEKLDVILDLAERMIIDVVQLHGSEDVEYMENLKKCCDVPVIKAISMTAEDFSEKIECWDSSSVDYLLLDSGAGGTGQAFDYGRIGYLAKPFFLAGGLHPGNVADAAQQVQPCGVDMSSGVETEGKKDKEKIREAVRRIRDVERKIR